MKSEIVMNKKKLIWIRSIFMKEWWNDGKTTCNAMMIAAGVLKAKWLELLTGIKEVIP